MFTSRVAEVKAHRRTTQVTNTLRTPLRRNFLDSQKGGDATQRDSELIDYCLGLGQQNPSVWGIDMNPRPC